MVWNAHTAATNLNVLIPSVLHWTEKACKEKRKKKFSLTGRRNRYKEGTDGTEKAFLARAGVFLEAQSVKGRVCAVCCIQGPNARVLHSSMKCPGQSRLCPCHFNKTHTHSFWFEQRLLQPEGPEGGWGGNFQIIWHIVERFRAYTCKRLLEVATYHFHLFGRVSLGILKEWEPNWKE